MNRSYSLASIKIIDSIFSTKDAKATKYFTILKKSNLDEHFHFLISIGRKYGNSVKRNLIKRRIKAIIDKNKLLIGLWDFVIIVKPLASGLDFQEIQKEIQWLLKKSTIIGECNEKK
jgi:ribonuclease P protein component